MNTYTIEIAFEVKMTSKGSPARGPSYSSGGEPAEPPEFEIEHIYVDGNAVSVEELYKIHKDKLPKNLPKEFQPSFDQFFADMIYDKILDQAAEDDDWGDADDGFEYGGD
jgi:hypothetical protein